MKIAPLAEVKDQFSAYIEACKESPVVVTKNGKPVALLTPIHENDDLDRILLMHNPRFRQILEESRQNIERTGGIPHKEFWARRKQRRAKQSKAS